MAVKTCLKPPMSIITSSGSICTFNALQEGLPLKSHKIALTATQSGSGTPSPSNPRPITGYSAINISYSDADTSTPTVHTITIGSTVYGGTYDAITGILTVTHQYFEFDGSVDEDWRIIGSGDVRRFGYDTGVSMTDASSAITNYLSYLYGKRGSWGTFAIANNTYIICHDNQSNFATLGDFTTYLSNNNLQLVAKLTTPTTIQLPPCPIDTLLGVNNIWANTGNTSLEAIKIGR